MENQVNYLLVFILYVSFAKLVAKYNYLLRLNITAIAFTIVNIENNSQG